jgi:uncharacterized protein
MSADLPERVDARRMAQMHREFEGEVPLARMQRLGESLASTEGSVRYSLAFDRDRSGLVTVQLHARGELPLVCQRTLETFAQPVVVDQRFGVIATEDEESTLPADIEPLLGIDGVIEPYATIEDELILALPLVPVMPGSAPVEPGDAGHPGEERGRNPFDALRGLRRS